MNLMESFKCECGNTVLLGIETNCTVKHQLISLEGGFADWDDTPTITSNGSFWFECSECGFKPEDEDGDYISTTSDLYHWLKDRYGEKVDDEDLSPSTFNYLKGDDAA